MKEEDYSGNTEKGIEAGKITAKGLSSFILEEFKSFTKTTKKINKHKIKKHHRRKSPAFTNMSKSEDVFQNPFQICKCYMPRDNNINRIEEADLFTLITAIYNFVHFKNRLSDFEPLYIEDLAKGKILLTGRQLLYYVDLLITLLVKVEAVNKDTSVSEDRKVSIKTSISDARKDLEKMKISIEHPPYKRYTFPIEDKRDTTAVEKKEERSFRSRKTLALALLIAKEDLQDFVTHVFEVFHRTLNKDNIIDEVRKKYKNGSPNLTNVCVEDLLNDPFNILKIFTGKYETLQQMTSASDMDLETMISAMLTFRDFDEKFSVDLKELKSQILSTDRVPDVQSVIWKLSKLLSDSKYQRNDKKAINAVKRLREDIPQTPPPYGRTEKRKEVEIWHSKRIADECILKTECLSFDDVMKLLENDAKLFRYIQDDHSEGTDLTETYNCIICNEKEKHVVTIPCLHFVLCGMCFEVWSNAGESRCPVCRANIDVAYIFEGWSWSTCIKTKNEEMAYDLLESKTLPDMKSLNDLCQDDGFGRKSTVAIDTCKKICLFIKSLSTNIVDVWAARNAVTLTPGDTFEIRFVVITENLNEESRKELENFIQSHYDTLPLRDCDHLSLEETQLTMKGGYKLREDDQNSIKACISLHAERLLQKHTYLSVISGCPFRSVGFDTNNPETVPTPCIVLNVQYKGYIPIDEEPFERKYDGVQVDVREDIFVLFNYTAKERHDNVKAGCLISGETDEREKCPKGTLGGFVNHPDYGLCGISCSHALLWPNELVQLADDSQEINWSRSTFPARRNGDTWQGNVYQPSKVETNEGDAADDNKIGRLVKVIYRRGSNEMDQCGIDAALFQLSNRLPNSSDFPAVRVAGEDIPPEGTNIDSPGHREIPVQFGTGTVGGFAWHDQRAYSKYGAITGYTVGELFDCSIAVKEPFKWTHADSFKYILHNQLSLSKPNKGGHDISPSDRPDESLDYFAFAGDSGALVHHETTDGKLVCVGLVVGGRKSQKTCIITPILPVLKAMGISDFKNFDGERMESNVKKMVVEMKTINTNIENMDREMKDGFTNISEQLTTMQNTGMRCEII